MLCLTASFTAKEVDQFQKNIILWPIFGFSKHVFLGAMQLVKPNGSGYGDSRRYPWSQDDLCTKTTEDRRYAEANDVELRVLTSLGKRFFSRCKTQPAWVQALPISIDIQKPPEELSELFGSRPHTDLTVFPTKQQHDDWVEEKTIPKSIGRTFMAA